MLKKGEFFQLVSNLFCVVKRGFVEPCKMFLCSKLPCLGGDLQTFYKVFFSKNVCWTSGNLIVLVIRFLCEGLCRGHLSTELEKPFEGYSGTEDWGSIPAKVSCFRTWYLKKITIIIFLIARAWILRGTLTTLSKENKSVCRLLPKCLFTLYASFGNCLS
jgi:hypothetical protein